MERVEERLAHYLLQISANQSSITLFMKMKDLALYLGTTPETLSRKLKYLEDHNLDELEKWLEGLGIFCERA